MNVHDEIPDDAHDEERIAFILGAAQSDSPAPDKEFLARLRGQSTDAFTAASSPSQAAPVAERKPTMFLRYSHWLKAAAAMVVVGAGLYFWLGASGVALSQVLDNLEKADTLHLCVSLGDKKMELWHTSNPKRSRWDDLDGNYRIEDGTKYWIVNEKANEAKRAIPPPTIRIKYQILHLLGLPDANRLTARPLDRMLASLPVERVRDGGQDVHVYRASVPNGDGKVHFEARVIAHTQRLLSIKTRLEKAGKIEPLGELVVLDLDAPIAVEKFAIADTLTEDGRIGKVTDVQGIVTIKPVLGERWTPVREHLVLRPGDWLRTDARGANATALRLVKQTGVILGPRTLVELIGPKQIRVIEGEIEVAAAAGTSIELLGPGPQSVTVKGRQFFRVVREQLARQEKEPPWLLGFKGVTANEALGSLVVLVDGRNVPLTVGHHKVTVDIKDQIARTVIEESFVNHTKTEMEGIFYFPLPADASISGFGMWIGDKLIEADVVEKQRAREIYETLKRQQRDPGLLEWSGGNIFTARVFPIPANAEKRIKISYTQVLPLRGSRYRYSYALQSELLQQHPLRRLDIDVQVNSVLPLKSVKSPTHPTRDDRTTHSAHVEFTAQEYTPTRDFEVVVEVDSRPGEVVLIPHRRGQDGYFMVQLTPPGADGNWDRPLLPNGAPLQLLILADTSASIDVGQRTTQAAFIGSLVSALSPKDTFNLATCDVGCDWVFAQPKTADGNNVATARDFLAGRSSLGWTNLDAAFAAAFKMSGPKTHVIYVGDGITTTGDADPVEFTKRLRRLYPGKGGTFHAVTLGSSYEAGVMKTIASLGSGSMRKITGEQGPTTVARELLAEIAQPPLRDLKVSFPGIKTARVYPDPDALPNIPAGTQQILLGRYLPEGKDQTGEVVITGMQGDKKVQFSTKVQLKDAEQGEGEAEGEGNSFIPRLWARMYLDSLLEQGSSESIRDEIISLSEEFNIITPYTSLLVLETDADRERFKVKRRFQMRDGDSMFAAGRDNAMFELAQKQKKKAGDWRTAMRRSVLSDLAGLGRRAAMFQADPSVYNLGVLGGENEFLNRPMGSPRFRGTMAGQFFDSSPHTIVYVLDNSRSLEGRLGDRERLWDGQAEGGDIPDGFLREDMGGKHDPWNSARQLRDGEPFGLDLLDGGVDVFNRTEPASLLLREPQSLSSAGGARPGGGGYYYFQPPVRAGFLMEGEDAYDLDFNLSLDYKSNRMTRNRRHGHWLSTLFPPLYRASQPKEVKTTWPALARDLARSLLRGEIKDGLEIVRQAETFEVRWGELTSRSHALELVSAKSWLTRTASDDGQTILTWCDAREIGTFSKAFQLGRVRASRPLDVQQPPLELSDYSLVSLERVFAKYTPTLQPQGKDRMLLVLKHPSTPLEETHILIDTARHVILSIENRLKGKITGTTRFDDFVERGGSWWAQRIESTDADGKRRSLITQKVKTLALNDLDQQIKTELSGRAQVQFLQLPLPSVLDAKKAVAAGKANFDHQFVLLLHFQRSEQWKRVFDHLLQAEKLAADKPGLHWVRSALLYEGRRHEDLRRRWQEDAARLVEGTSSDLYFLAEHIVIQAPQVLQANEMLTLLDSLKPIYDKQPAHVMARKHWLYMRSTYLTQVGRSAEALALQKQLAVDYPRDYFRQREYAQALVNTGDYAKAYAWLTGVLVKEAKWSESEEDSLRTTYAEFLRQQGLYPELVKFLAEWVGRNPSGVSAYQQYLSALFRADQIDRARTLMTQWIEEGLDKARQGDLPAAVVARLNAAVYLMLGQGYNLQCNIMQEPRWVTQLAEVVAIFARHETHGDIADHIMAQQSFRRTDQARKLRKTFAGILSAEVDKLPAEQIQRFFGWARYEDVSQAGWEKISQAVRQRWTNETKDDLKYILGATLVDLLSNKGTPAELLAFLRLQWQTGPTQHRDQYAHQLFDWLLRQPWSAELEVEAFAMFDKMSSADEPGVRLYASVAALHRLTDRLLDARIAARIQALEHPEKLKRPDLFKKLAEIRKQAREELADRLHKQAAQHSKALAPWLIAESLYLDLPIDRSLPQAAAEAWQYLGDAPPVFVRGQEITPDVAVERFLDDTLRQRYLVTLTNLAARKGAEPALIERLVKYLDKAIEADPEDGRWKLAKTRLFVALDRTKDLEQTLRQWTRDAEADSRWRIALGYLLAEQGQLPEAIRQFEVVEKADELSPDAYSSLADWYLLQGQREDHERAALAVYKTTPEYRLNQFISAKLHPWQRSDGRLPTQLDKEVMKMFTVLFDKSASPQAYLPLLQQFYEASRDSRLLTGLADAVVGHTAERVYPFLSGMKSVLDEVRGEPAADEIVKRIGAVRARAKTDVDQRALDLLELLVERRAAELQNQPGPHRDRALAALRQAFKRTWAPGERRLMADFLVSLGRISQPALAEEQLRQLKTLYTETTGALDRLHVAHNYATVLRDYDRRNDAIDLLQSALSELQTSHGGVLPTAANDVLSTFISYLYVSGQHTRAEKFFLAQLEQPVHPQQRRWLIEQLDRYYHYTLQSQGEVSLGKGLDLYRALSAKILKDLADPNDDHRMNLIVLQCEVYHTADGQKLAGVAADVKKFAFQVLPPILKEVTNHHDTIVGSVAKTVHDVAGARDGMAFLLDEIDREPRWLRYNNHDGWTRHCDTLGQWRTEVKVLGDVEGRLLKLVLAELRRDLETREPRNPAIYYHTREIKREHLFWKDKEPDFARTADEVLATNNQSDAAVQYIADYFYHGLWQPKRAIEVLFIAHNQGLLDHDGQAKLVNYLHQEKRFGESIDLLRAFVKSRPDSLEYRVQLMRAFFHTDRNAELLSLLKETDAYFHDKNRWGEDPLSRLAGITLETKLFDQAVAYYKEVIDLHERTHANRGIGDGTLANYNMGLARAYAGLKKTAEAVDAAGAAIVAWGSRSHNREEALKTLKHVLLDSPNLDAYVGEFDKQKQDSAIIRKALGQAYSDKKEHAKAIEQLKLAATLQPNDAEIYKLLIESYDALGDKEGALRQQLHAVQLLRRDLKLYQDLGERYTAAGQPAEAERAFTSIIEMLPTDADSHSLLAEVRQKQNRWAEAILQWQDAVRLRPLEPTPLVKLAEAQIHEKKWDEAQETLDRLRARNWPPRFIEERKQIRAIEEKLAKQRMQ